MAIDAFLQIYKGGVSIKGESTDSVFTGAIELNEFDLDALSRVEADLDGSKPKPTPTPHKPGDSSLAPIDAPEEEPADSFSFSIEKEFDTSSTELFLNYCATASGKPQPFQRAVVSLCVGGKPRKQQDDAYLQVEFNQAYVVKWEISVGDKNIAKEEVEFYFESYLMKYKKQMPDGTFKAVVPMGFNFETNTKK